MKKKWIVIHHSASSLTTTTSQIDAWHKKRWRFKSELGHYAGYQRIITYDGVEHRMRKDTEEAAHAIGYNTSSIGICLTGNFENVRPTSAQKSTLKSVLDKLSKKYNIPKSRILGHKDVSNTKCPGKYLYKWLQDYKLREKVLRRLRKKVLLLLKKVRDKLKILIKNKK